jgi:hypothetical protein
VDEVPRLQAPLLSLDQDEALARDDEEVLLDALPVVEPVRLPRPQNVDVHPVLRELELALVGSRRAEVVALPPRRVRGVDHEPSVERRNEAVLEAVPGLLEARFVGHPGRA